MSSKYDQVWELLHKENAKDNFARVLGLVERECLLSWKAADEVGDGGWIARAGVATMFAQFLTALDEAGRERLRQEFTAYIDQKAKEYSG